MNEITTKTKLALLPLLLLGVIFIVSYSFLYWIFYVRLNVSPLKEDIVRIWMPVGLSLICVFVYIRPRIHLFKLDRDNGRVRPLYYMVGAAAFCIPTIIALNYLESATGRLTALNSIEEITQRPFTKYYTVSSCIPAKQYMGVESAMSYSGKRNQYLNFDIYIATPLLAEDIEEKRSTGSFLSVHDHKQVSSDLSDVERRREWTVFWQENLEKYSNDSIHFVYLERMGNNENRDHLVSAAKRSVDYKAGTPVTILEPVDAPFEKRNGNKLAYLFLSFGIGYIVWFIMIMIPGLHRDKAKNFASGKKSYVKQELVGGYALLKPRKGFAATPVLISLNTLVFIIMVFAGFGFLQFYSADLVRLGAIYKPAIQSGEWWRLITAMFLHGGVMHLFMNMVSLYIAGIILENVIGTRKFIIGYFLSGIAAGLVSIWWHHQPVVAIGASGAIFGLYGILLMLVILKVFDGSFNKFLLVLLACTAGYSLLMGLLSEGIDNSAHIGGLVAGLVIGVFFAFPIRNKGLIRLKNKKASNPSTRSGL